MKLHLGCGKNILEGYINIDAYVEAEGVQQLDILNLPYPDNTVHEILAEHLVEHLSYQQEERFWRECYRLLVKGGVLIVETPDMEWLCQQFLDGIDDFKEFYKVGAKDHYFGNGRSIEHRWGILTTHFFGNQNGEGQFHFNGFTKPKMLKIRELIGFSSCEVTKICSKGAHAIVARFVK